MRYHNITHDDLLNGPGIRVVLWTAGCSHHCEGCHNPITWDPNGGLKFTEEEIKEIFNELEKDYVSGITLSGGDPFHEDNIADILFLCDAIRCKFGKDKTIWIYTGYTWEELMTDRSNEGRIRRQILQVSDVLIDGKFDKTLASIDYKWAGSTNQRIIDIQKTLKEGTIILRD